MGNPRTRRKRLAALCLAGLLWACNRPDHAAEPVVNESPRAAPAVAGASATPAYLELWQTYRQRFIRDGRVLDMDNGGISHSEGQGYGMLLAEAAGDRQTFDQLLAWTQTHLARADGLFAWRYAPCSAGLDRAAIAAATGRPADSADATDCITDPNNASDGEILIAWALLKAGERWQSPDYTAAARRIATALQPLIVQRHQHSLLLPGLQGFDHPQADGDGRVVVNLSYWIFPALDALARHFPDQGWQALADSGLALLRAARFGAHQLPPDWLEIDGPAASDMRPASGFEPVYGFNAVRIPLHLVWGRQRWTEQDLAPYLGWWTTKPDEGYAAWVNLQDGSEAGYRASAGVRGIARLATARATHQQLDIASWPPPGEEDGYFSWSLALLARIAAQESAK